MERLSSTFTDNNTQTGVEKATCPPMWAQWALSRSRASWLVVRKKVAQHSFCYIDKNLAEWRMQMFSLGQRSSSCDRQLVLHLAFTDKPFLYTWLDLNLNYLLEYIFNTWMCVSQTCCQWGECTSKSIKLEADEGVGAVLCRSKWLRCVSVWHVPFHLGLLGAG